MAALLLYSSVPKAYAEEEKTYAFDAVSVEKDLESIEGFNYINYPYDPVGFHSPQIFNVAEWAYSFDEARRDDYALYVYFYNPQGLDIHEDSNQNKIVLAVDYDKYPITQDSLPTSYETFDLAFCSKTGGDYANLFYKYRVIDHKSADGKTIAERVNSNGRRYDISEILLKTRGEDNATAYGVGGTYYFTGYAAGYGADENAASTLTCEVVDLETVELEVESTFFRTESSSLGKGYQNQLNTVYFGVPNELLSKYGKLQKVEAEWQEYITNPIYITTDYNAYNNFKQYVDKNIGEEYNPDLKYGLGFGWHGQGGFDFFTDGYNVFKSSDDISSTVSSVNNIINSIQYIFYVNEINQDETVISSEDLMQYILNAGAWGELLPIKDGVIRKNLFTPGLSADREKVPYMGDDIHHKHVNIDAGSTFDMLSYNETHSFWDKIFDYGLFSQSTINDTYVDIPPIYRVTEQDLQKNDDLLSKDLFIDKNDLSDFKAYADTAASKNQTVHLFRFAQTDYYSETGRTTSGERDFIYGNAGKPNSAMRAWETVFFDFTVISLTFNKEGVYRVIPAVSSPMDITGDVISPPEESFWLTDILNDTWNGIKNLFSGIWDAIKNFFNSLFGGIGSGLGAWGMLILSIIVGILILIAELKILELVITKIHNKPLRIIALILFIALFVFLDYLAVNFVITTINGLGGLV